MTSAIIIQARMASTRLPGKVMLPLGGRTALTHVLERAKAVSGADVVCCAIPDSDDCNVLADEAKRCNVSVFRGSEEDVLQRYFGAAKSLNAEYIVRVTSDCPLLDPEIVNGVLNTLREKHADYASNNYGETGDKLNTMFSWPHGLDCEAFTFEMLKEAANTAVSPFEREHVSVYIRSHPGINKLGYEGPGGQLADHRWTLDTPEDYDFLARLFNVLPKCDFRWLTTLSIIESFPDLLALSLREPR